MDPRAGPALAGRVALVTGASRGIGRGIAIGLGEAGSTVYVTGRTQRPGEASLPGSIAETAAAVTAAGGRGIPVRCDHAVDTDVEAVFERISREAGRLDILVNNATALQQASVLWSGKRFWEVPISTWDALTDVGLRSHFVAAWYAAPLMIAQGAGLIVNVSSGAAVRKFGLLPYSVGKAALDRLTADLAQELAGHGIAVVSVWPPPTLTEGVQAEPELFEDLSTWSAPLFTGRVVAALAAEADLSSRSGQALQVKALAAELGVAEEA